MWVSVAFTVGLCLLSAVPFLLPFVSGRRRAQRRGRQLKGYYGIDRPGKCRSVALNGVGATLSAVLLCFTFRSVVRRLRAALPWLPSQISSVAIAFALTVMSLLALANWVLLASLLHTSLFTRFRMARKMVAHIPDWSNVARVLDIGCGKGLLLNTAALRLQKEGAGGRAVGLDSWPRDGGGSMAKTLQMAMLEGVGAIVTCKSGDCRNLPFVDAFFDVVLSMLSLHTLGEDFLSAGDDDAAAREWRRAMAEVVRVARPGAHIVIWDILHAPLYAEYLRDQGLEVRLSRPLVAFMLRSHIVFARKPREPK